MNQRYAGIELKKIEDLARKIMRERKCQSYGTEYQKWTHALLKATEEYHDTNE
tara:strand:- start:22 stop:180 length:159 start_codon:yes stop_codon:yes gene_type:complete